MDLKSLFLDHLKVRQAHVEKALQATQWDTLVISAGEPYTYFMDDADAPFRATPHFRHYCPLAGPHHVLVLASGKKPKLIRYAPEDFWYEQLTLDMIWGGKPFWQDGFELIECPSLDKVWETVGTPARAAYIGNETDRAEKAGLTCNPQNMTVYLDWARAFKTPYEVHCMEEATILGAKGHMAGKEAFFRGGSELDIHHAFVAAVGCQDHDLSFASIVALNEKGATLHYENKRDVRSGQTLVLDAGARYNGYPSDITRSYALGSCHPTFLALLEEMKQLTSELCDGCKPGVPFPELHHACHLKEAAILQRAGILKCGPEEACAKGLTYPFLPHGLGHLLGIQVHEIGGRLIAPDGTIAPPPANYPTLRTTRTLEVGYVITIEPGLYFIPMLLRRFRENEHAALFDWSLIDTLTPYGGIRIEDDILVTEKGHRNLTRPHLAL